MVIDSDKPEYALPGARYEVAISSRRARKVRETYVFREATRANQWISIR